MTAATWRAEVDEIAGPGVPLYVPLLVSPDGSTYRERGRKSYDDALFVAQHFASALNDGTTHVILQGWSRSEGSAP